MAIFLQGVGLTWLPYCNGRQALSLSTSCRAWWRFPATVNGPGSGRAMGAATVTRRITLVVIRG